MSIKYIVEVYDLDRIGLNKLVELQPKTFEEYNSTLENLMQWYGNPDKYKVVGYQMKKGDD